MIIDSIGIETLHWHFWVGVGISVIVNALISMSNYFRLKMPWLYLIMPILFGIIIWVAGGFIIQVFNGGLII